MLSHFSKLLRSRFFLSLVCGVAFSLFGISSAFAECAEYYSSNYDHVENGRAVRCGLTNSYVCAIGSGENLGLWNIYTFSTLVEESPGYYAVGFCVTGECNTASNADHVTAGRAHTATSGWWWLTTTTWYANGTNDNMGTDSATQVSLENRGENTWRVVGECPAIFPPEVEFSASRTSIIEGESIELTWTTENALSVDIQPDIGTVDLNGSLIVYPEETVTYTITATGDGDLVTTKTIDVEVTPSLAVEVQASVIEGYAPLTVRLSPFVSTQNAINRYYWDFKGDGGPIDGGLGIEGTNGFDEVESLLHPGSYINFDSTGRDFEFTYTDSGIYNPRLRVWDAEGEQELATVQINVLNRPPEVSAGADVTNGEIPLTVNFSVSATDYEGIADYKWDFDGDGVDDETTTSTSIQHIYTEIGTYQARVTVTDVLGESTVVGLPHIEIRAVPEGDPSVQLSGVPVTGTVPLNVSFSGAANVPSGSDITSWEWDYDGDGVFETGTSSGAYLYNSAGTYYPRVKITTAAGKSAEDVVQVIASPKFDFSVLDKSFDPEVVENSARISLTVYGQSEVSIVIESRSGSEVKTVLDWTALLAGTYEYTWDGKNTAGDILPPADYYAVLKYKVQDVIHEIDLRDTTGGEIFYPRDPQWRGYCVRGITPCGTTDVPNESPLEPFNNKPWVFTIDIPHVADLTCYMSVYTTNDIVSSFFQKRAVSNGVHKVVWNGEGTDSRLLPQVGTSYLITVMGHTLADNVIYLNHGPVLTASSVEPIFFDPSRKVGVNGNKTKLVFDLSKTSDIEFWVNDMSTGKEVFRKTVESVVAGADVNIEWDGRGNHGSLVAPGEYIMGAKAVVDGYESLPVKGVLKVKY